MARQRKDEGNKGTGEEEKAQTATFYTTYIQLILNHKHTQSYSNSVVR